MLPLNWDPLTDLVLKLVNTQIFQNFQGVLDNEGKATAIFNMPALPPGYTNLKFYFAYTLYNPYNFVSNPVSIAVIG